MLGQSAKGVVQAAAEAAAQATGACHEPYLAVRPLRWVRCIDKQQPCCCKEPGTFGSQWLTRFIDGQLTWVTGSLVALVSISSFLITASKIKPQNVTPYHSVLGWQAVVTLENSCRTMHMCRRKLNSGVRMSLSCIIIWSSTTATHVPCHGGRATDLSPLRYRSRRLRCKCQPATALQCVLNPFCVVLMLFD